METRVSLLSIAKEQLNFKRTISVPNTLFQLIINLMITYCYRNEKNHNKLNNLAPTLMVRKPLFVGQHASNH